MHNPKNWKNSSRAKSNFSKSGWISVLQEGVENVCSYVTCHVTLIGSWQSKHPKLHQAELPPCIQCTGVRQTNNGCVQAYFSSPPRLCPLFWRVSLSLGIIFWLAPTLGQWVPVRLLCSLALQWPEILPEIRPNLRGSVFFGSIPAGMLFTKRKRK